MKNASGGMTIKYLLNCAVLITCGGEKILVDGLFSGNQPFDIMDPSVEEDIIHGRGEFEGLRYLIVTHCHNDHYNGSKIIRCLKNNPGITLIVPSNARLDAERLAGARANIIVMREAVGILRKIRTDGPRIEYMKTEHLTFRYPEHYCVNIVFGDENVLLTADMDVGRIRSLRNFSKRGNSTIFVNSIQLWHRKWRQQLRELAYDRVFFYHVASEDRDSWGYRARALLYWNRFGEEFPNGMLLNT